MADEIYGLTPNGFNPKRLDVMVDEVQTDIREGVNPGFSVLGDDPFGQVIGAFCNRLQDLWDLGLGMWDAMNPDVAEDQVLGNIGEYVGIERDPASKSSGTLFCEGDNGTVIPVGTQVRVQNNGPIIVTTSEGTISSSSVDVDGEALDEGVLEIGDSVFLDIVTPITGFDDCSTKDEFGGGREIETDPEYRLSLEQQKQGVSKATDGSIRNDILDVTNVTQATVISNRTDSVDSYGIPKKSFWSIVYPETGVDDDEVAAAILASHPSGIESYGSTTIQQIDSQGFEVDISFSFATSLSIAVVSDITVDSLVFPSDGVAQIIEKIRTYFAGVLQSDGVTRIGGLLVGQDVIYGKVDSAIFDVDGVLTSSLTLNGGIVNISVDVNKYAVLDPDPPTINVV